MGALLMTKSNDISARRDEIPGLLLGTVFFAACVVLAAVALIDLFAYLQVGAGGSVPIFAAERVKTPLQLNPEPIERSVFLILAALAPIVLVGSAKVIRGRAPNKWIYGFLVVALTMLLAFPFFGSDFSSVMFFPASLSTASKPAMLGLSLLLATSVLVVPTRKMQHSSSFALTVGAGVAAALIFQVSPYRLASDNMVTLASQWSVSYDAAIYALTQVVSGKTLLHDLPSQYGLFPELIAPLFKKINISIVSINSLFISLQVLALGCLAAVLHFHVRNILLRAMTFICLLISTGLFLYLNDIKQEIYLQYFPIRFVCPAVALFLFSYYSYKPTLFRLSLLGVAAGVAFFWNFDSGVPVLVSIGATLLVKPFLRQPLKLNVLRPAFIFTSIATLAFSFMMLALRIKAGAPLGIQEAIAYQKLFYGSGFMMLPMPTSFHPWQIILVVYSAAAVVAVSAWRRNLDNHVYDLLFCISLLGVGLFTYYQGRSHIFCLMMVIWPALIAGGILTDLILRSIRNRSTSPASALLAVPFILFVSLGTVTMAFSARHLITEGIENIASFQNARDSVVASELAFLRSTNRGRNCLILAQRQAIYHAELKSGSPIPGPGMIETLLQSDLDTLMERALTTKLECIYLGVGPTSQTLAKLDDEKLIATYPITAKNDLGTLLLLEPKRPASTN
jgi:hypothetical protein